MPKNIVICFDGTNNKFGPENTNVVRLVQLLERDPLTQRLYYDPGVGTLPEPGVWSKAGKKVSEIFGLAFGRGLSWKVEEAYSYLMDFWELGDRVLIFGFSRGAYSARVLAGMLHALGLLPRGNHNLIPYVMDLYGALRRERSGPGQWTALCDQFRWTFARLVPEDKEQRHFHVHYLGLWDTVSSVGWVWDAAKYPYTARNPSLQAARHAISIDERRWFFRQNRMNAATPGQLEQLWFPGVHSDIGGGYPRSEGALWREPFLWILDGAEKAGLRVDEGRRSQVVPQAKTDATATDEKHESLKGLWWLAEFFPKWRWNSETQRNRPDIGAGRFRSIGRGDRLDRSALVRLRADSAYRPKNIAPKFVEDLRSLPAVPDTMPYDPGDFRQKYDVRLTIIALLSATVIAALGATALLRSAMWIAEQSNSVCNQAQATAPYLTSQPCWDIGARVIDGKRYQVTLTVAANNPWKDLGIDATPLGFGASKMTAVGNLFTPLRRSLRGRWFQPMVKIVPDFGRFRLLPLEMQESDSAAAVYEGQFTAPTSGRAFLFVNDVLLPTWLPKHRFFYDNNQGAASAVELKVLDRVRR